MNFFGHAAMACGTDHRAAFVLGSMLPDFESMTGQRVLAVSHTPVREGIALHHRVDAIFHHSRPFVRLCADTVRRFSHVGVRRGSARASAHLAIEMFLDGVLAEQDAIHDRYMAALETGASPDMHTHLDWTDSGEAYAALCTRLRRWGRPADYNDPDFVLQRLHDALRARPRLRIHTEDAPQIARILPGLRAEVHQNVPELIAPLQNALGLRWGT